MTLQETIQKIEGLQHLIGQKVPRWDAPILEIIPAPMSNKFAEYIEIYSKTGDVKKAILIARSDPFGVLLIFRKPQLHSALQYEWYSYFYKK